MFCPTRYPAKKNPCFYISYILVHIKLKLLDINAEQINNLK